MAQHDWVEWHRDYDDPGSLLSRRGELVQGHLRAELERAPAGDVRLNVAAIRGLCLGLVGHGGEATSPAGMSE